MPDSTNDRDAIFKSYMDGLPNEEEVITDDTTDVTDTTTTDTATTGNTTSTENTETTDTTTTETTTTTEPTIVEKEVQVEVIKWKEPEFKSDKDRYVYEQIVAGNEEEIFKTLHDKYAYKTMSADNKLMSYLAIQNPGLDEDDLSFLAAKDYGVGATDIDLETATAEERDALRQQDISRKRLLSQANSYFEERANKIELPSVTNPADADEDYKAYKQNLVTQNEQAKQFEENTKALNAEIDSTAPSIVEVKTEVKIKVDESELAFDVNFNLDQKKQQQLAQYAKDYTPTEAEYKAYTDQSNGKFDMRGYMQGLTEKLFHKQIVAAAVKQAIAHDRERFVEGTLKNSTLRNNDVSLETSTVVNEYDAYWAARAR